MNCSILSRVFETLKVYKTAIRGSKNHLKLFYYYLFCFIKNVQIYLYLGINKENIKI